MEVPLIDTDERRRQLEEPVEREATLLLSMEDAVSLRKDGPLCFGNASAFPWRHSRLALGIGQFQFDKVQAFVSICMASLGGRAGTTLAGAGGSGAAIASG